MEGRYRKDELTGNGGGFDAGSEHCAAFLLYFTSRVDVSGGPVSQVELICEELVIGIGGRPLEVWGTPAR